MAYRTLKRLTFAALWIAICATPLAQVRTDTDGAAQPARLRGHVVEINPKLLTLRRADGTQIRIGLSSATTVFTLTPASYADVDFGKYVGAVSEKMGDHIYSPIVRDSLAWLHRGYELRIIDESLRGIAVGHTAWDLTAKSVMTHGWVDDIEQRVISIKYGPTEEEENDVGIFRDTPVYRMSLGDIRGVRPGMRIFAGAQKTSAGYAAAFIFFGKDGAEPSL